MPDGFFGASDQGNQSGMPPGLEPVAPTDPEPPEGSPWPGELLFAYDNMLDEVWNKTKEIAEFCGSMAPATAVTFLLLFLMATVYIAMAAAMESRPFAIGRKRRAPLPVWCCMVLALKNLAVVSAVPALDDAVRPSTVAEPPQQTRPPRPSDLELWSAGQLTLREQLLQAEARHISGMPLEHLSERYEPINYHEPAEPNEEWIENEIDPDAARAEHLSFLVLAPYFEPEILDLAVAMPISLDRMFEVIKDTVRDMPTWLSHAVAVEPQLHEDFGTVLLVPGWVPLSGRWAVVLDGDQVGRGVFACYVQEPVSRRAVLEQLQLDQYAEVDIFAYGSLAPMGLEETVPPKQGGLIRILPRGAVVEWATDLENRLSSATGWNPDTEPPTSRSGRYLALQSEDNQAIVQATANIATDPLLAAADALGLARGTVWLRAPTHRIERLCERGRRVRSTVAVVNAEAFPIRSTTIVFLDLRGVALWPQWVALPRPIFDAAAYVEGLQVEYQRGWSLVVYGGIRRPDGRLNVDDGERLTVTLRLDEDISATEESESGGEDSDTDSSHDGEEDHTRPMDVEPAVERPTPSTTRRPSRSRSPRGEGTGDTHISLAASLPPATFNLDTNSVQLPHTNQDIHLLRRPWSKDWMKADFQDVDMHPAAKDALDKAKAIPDLLGQASETTAEVVLYTDGSAEQLHQRSGYSVIILLRIGAAFAVMGALGGQLKGSSATLWHDLEPMALHAEQVALATALLWILQAQAVLPAFHCNVFYDCLAAGHAADGTWTALNDIGQRTHNIELLIRATPGLCVDFHHVKGHSGDPWNECADCVAKAVAAGHLTIAEPPEEVTRYFLTGHLEWMATEVLAMTTGNLPATNGWMIWKDVPFEPSQLQPSDLVPIQAAKVREGMEGHRLQVRAASVNIQGMGGNYQFVEAQLHELGMNIACIQETKGRAGTVHGRHYLRFATESEKYWGTAIWIHRQLGLLAQNGKGLPIVEDEVTTLHESPRLLAISIKKETVKIVVVSGHCPHADRDDRPVFFAALRQILSRAKYATLLILGIDLNGRLPTNFEPATGDLAYDEPDQCGREMANLMNDTGLWAPSTFCALHRGSSATYCHPSGKQSRIDYVMVGGRAKIEEAISKVNQEFDNGSPNDDHKLVEVELRGHLDGTAQTTSLWRPRYDVAKLYDQEGRRAFKEALGGYVQPPWATGPDEHCKHLQAFLNDTLASLFPMPRCDRASYIPQPVWPLRDKKMMLKQKTRYRLATYHELLRRAWQRWKSPECPAAPEIFPKPILMHQLVASAIKIATYKIKSMIAKAKDDFMDNLISSGPQNVSAILHRAKKAGIGGRKSRPINRPLPSLLDPSNGQVTETRQDRDRVWLEYFGQQEYGSITTVKDFLKDQSVYQGDIDEPWTADLLPSLLDIENALRQVPKGKTAGLDGIPSDAMRVCPSQLAPLLQPLFIKSLVGGRQPSQWRGGFLYECYKGTGTQDRVEHFRSLYISSFAGKVLHKTMRNKVQDNVESLLHPMHYGSRKGAPVLFPALYVATHLKRCRQLGLNAAVLFVDCRAAYYRLARELATGKLTSDLEVLQLFARFGLDGEDVADLMNLITSGGMLKEAEIPGPIRRAACDFHLGTWFITRHSQGDLLCQSQAGSRPGGPWADTLFAFIYARVLYRVHENLVGEDLLFQLHWNPGAGIFQDDQTLETMDAWDTTWADDTALPLQADRAEDLLRKTKRACAIMVTVLRSHGLDPNLKRHKTSVLLRLHGRGSKKARQAFFADGKPELKMEDIQEAIPIVDTYKHLGGMLDMGVTFAAEARYRRSLAVGAFDTARQLLLQNPQLEVVTRGKLFESIVSPTFFNLALWLPEGKQWQQLSDGYSRQVRRLLGREVKGNDFFHIPTPWAHIATGCVPLEMLAFRARISLLTSMVMAAPPTLWAMLQEEGQWMKQLQADLVRLVGKTTDTWPEVSEASWPQWWHLLKTSAPRVRRAVAHRIRDDFDLYKEEEATNLCLWALQKDQAKQSTPQQVELSWCCRMCQKNFGKRAALSVHFFAVHRRTAAYRAWVDGTLCKACNTEFWSRARLEDHLRASGKCVETLRGQGPPGGKVHPGYGSRHRHKEAKENFTPAPPRQLGNHEAPLLQATDNEWEQKLHRELSAEILSIEDHDSGEAIRSRIDATIRNFPLYQEEIDKVAKKLQDEVELVHGDQDLQQWVPVQFDEIKSSLEAAKRPPPVAVEQARPPKMPTYGEFRRQIDDFNWPEASVERNGHGTPDKVFVLDDDWEAAWCRHRKALSVAAVTEDLRMLLPPVLHKVWLEVQAQRQVLVWAPRSFWEHRLSSPFRGFREGFASPN